MVPLLLVFLASLALCALSASPASAETRVLKIYHVHTGEKAVIAYKRNGHYIPAGLKKLDYILRDWRKDKETDMDPRVLDLLWEVYQQSGSHDYIHIICGYRTGDTNAMLRGRSRASGVAKASQHILGKAIDFYIPDVQLEKLREIGMKFQVGGVGYYPNSGSPFVHMDTGWVRAWPRMSRDQLVRLFPHGRTLHLPPDGKPLPGYDEALADYKRRVSGDSIMVAGGGSSGSARSGGNFLAALFGRGNTGDEDESGDDDSGAATASSSPRLNQAPAPATEVADATPAPRAPVSLPPARQAPLPSMRPPTTAPAVAGTPPLPGVDVPDDGATDQGVQVADAETTPKYADLLAYAIPVPSDAPGREAVAPGADAALAAVEQEGAGKVDTAQGDVASVPVPNLRPELTAYAPTAASPAAELAAVLAPAPPAEVGPVRAASNARSPDHRPVTPAVARADDRPVVLASLAPVPGIRPLLGEGLRTADAPQPAPAPKRLRQEKSSVKAAKAAKTKALPAVERFATVSGTAIRGGRVAPADAPASGVLTREILAKWAIAKAGRDALSGSVADGASPRMNRLQPVAGSAHGDGVDPQRFAAVSVYFPND